MNTILAAAIPFLLLPSTALVFTRASRRLGREKGYLLGFLFYWMVWCLLVPLLLLGRAGFSSLFVDEAPLLSRPNWLAVVLWAVITLVTILMYARDFIRASPTLILIAIPAATVNGLCEEILWRGLYFSLFPGNFWLSILFPSIGFALWHLVPLQVFPEGSRSAFVLSTFFLGLAYGFIACKTGSVTWTALSHSLSGILALSGMIAPSLLAVSRR
ncbi:MAG: CPBP family intramembrane glutamic endopeptidase [Chloroflexota bacterium]